MRWVCPLSDWYGFDYSVIFSEKMSNVCDVCAIEIIVAICMCLNCSIFVGSDLSAIFAIYMGLVGLCFRVTSYCNGTFSFHCCIYLTSVHSVPFIFVSVLCLCCIETPNWFLCAKLVFFMDYTVWIICARYNCLLSLKSSPSFRALLRSIL